MFDRCNSGMLKNSFLGKNVFFMTLTTAPVAVDGCSDIEKLKLIKKNFDVLRKRYVVDFVFGNYCHGKLCSNRSYYVQHFPGADCYYFVWHCLFLGNFPLVFFANYLND